MDGQGFRRWATPAAILAAGAAVCVTIAVGDAGARREAQATTRAVERIEVELVTARTPGRR